MIKLLKYIVILIFSVEVVEVADIDYNQVCKQTFSFELY